MIKKYKKKPIVVEAIQWDGTEESTLEILKWMNGDLERFKRVAIGMAKAYTEVEKISIQTLEGIMFVLKGDYIIKGIKKNFILVNQIYSKKTYEEVI